MVIRFIIYFLAVFGGFWILWGLFLGGLPVIERVASGLGYDPVSGDIAVGFTVFLAAFVGCMIIYAQENP